MQRPLLQLIYIKLSALHVIVNLVILDDWESVKELQALCGGMDLIPIYGERKLSLYKIFIHRKKGSNTKTQQYRHKCKQSENTTKSVALVDTWYWSINKRYNHLCSPNLIMYYKLQLVTKLAKNIHCRNIS